MPQTTLKHLLHKEIVHVECVDGQSTVIAIVFSFWFSSMPSHNLSEQLCKLEDRYTVQCVHSHWDLNTMLLNPSQILF